VLTAIGLYQTCDRGVAHVAWTRRPTGIMGTECLLVAVVPHGHKPRAEAALDAAEQALRSVETRMSTWLEDSEISRLNRAKAGESIALSAPTLEVLQAAKRLADATDGAFDITCRPLIELWREAGRSGALPSPTSIETARLASSWDALVLEEGAASKMRDTVCVDLGGIAKGYAIDRAIEAMIAEGVSGALVDVGGDLRFFGRSPPDGFPEHQRILEEAHPGGWPWSIRIRNPHGDEPLGSIHLREGAVCTSGGYARFVTIEGRRYSHIVDPRGGRPTDDAPSITVIAKDALTADVWATALAVLGAEGLERLDDPAIQALLVRGRPESLEASLTEGMLLHLNDPEWLRFSTIWSPSSRAWVNSRDQRPR